MGAYLLHAAQNTCRVVLKIKRVWRKVCLIGYMRGVNRIIIRLDELNGVACYKEQCYVRIRYV